MAYLVLLHCRAIPNLKTLLIYTLPYYIVGMFPILKYSDVSSVSLHCWAISILKHCWCLPWLITLLSCSESYDIAEPYLVLLHHWAVSNLESLLTYGLSFYIAEKFPILKHCWRITCTITWPGYTLPQYIVDSL